MSPVEKVRQITDTTRISLPMAAAFSLLSLAGGAVAAGYSAKEQILSRVDVAIKQKSAEDRQWAEDRFMTRLEFVDQVKPRLTRIETKLDQVLRR